MPLWLFVVGIFGGLLCLGFIIDYRAKKKNRRIEPEEGIRNASSSQQIYTEQYLDQERKNTGYDNLH
ncbi:MULTISPECIES: hypothetical protein [Bacillaceae]|uniref:hypothetical protein n=1 Tax=Bacillaceae TaxID=186817 RepID=UPI002A14D76F|nr:hypothetical protein [Cytobacillus sp. IB215316]MDX8362730.1 hypothetical protein [Cytobacillus sp. IB215316]